MEIIKKGLRKLKNIWFVLSIYLKQTKCFGGKFLFYEKETNKVLLIVFSALNPNDKKRTYNYVRSLNIDTVDKLYILDIWGYRGSYYVYEQGNSTPEIITSRIIEKTFKSKSYKYVITAGTSKGGSAAIYYGLKYKVNEIWTGANQFHIGKFLWKEERRRIFYGMMGEKHVEENIKILNELLPNIIKNCNKKEVKINLVFSKKDLTYERQLVDMITLFKDEGYNLNLYEENFENHDDVGKCFPRILLKRLESLK